ncbi:MAG: type 1 glutamine amidotransferase [Candidatus Margulisiibacteriota bacterium]|jgi:GMP synthase (glutamine-hydrolysing)
MRIHYLQHESFEGPSYIADYAAKHFCTITGSKLYLGEPLPPLDSFDLLLILGGPMNIHEEYKYPWLKAEKHFIRKVISVNKCVLGICLGSQLLADVLGGSVTKNAFTEIGWFPVSSTWPVLPAEFTAFHWHGDTFSAPAGSIPFASSKACPNQGFIYHEKVIGLQFHLEITASYIQDMFANAWDDKTGGPYVQSKEQILAKIDNVKANNLLMDRIMGYFVEMTAG